MQSFIDLEEILKDALLCVVHPHSLAMKYGAMLAFGSWRARPRMHLLLLLAHIIFEDLLNTLRNTRQLQFAQAILRTLEKPYPLPAKCEQIEPPSYREQGQERLDFEAIRSQNEFLKLDG